MTRQFIDADGRITFGSHKSKHFSTVPKAWLGWACESVKGFANQLERAKLPKPAKKTGRYYQLDYTKRYERRTRSNEGGN